MAALLGLFGATSASAADWQALAPADTARSEGSLVMHDGGVYHFNGFDGRIDIQTDVERYDLASGRWRDVASTRTSGSAPSAVTHAGVVKVGRQVWFIGGRVGNHPGRVAKHVAVFDLDSYTWSQGPSLPRPFAGGGAALVGQRLHVFGGLDHVARCDIDAHWVYDLARPQDGWQDLRGSSPFPNPRNHFATVERDGIIYAIGGQRGHGYCAGLPRQLEQTRHVHAYDAANDRWSRLADLPWGQSHAEPGTFAHAGKLWSVGGQENGERVVSYDPSTDAWTWERELNLPEPLLAPGARIVDGDLMLFGGGAPNVFKPRRNTWRMKVPGLAGVTDVPPTTTVPTPAVYRINVGGPRLTDAQGRLWQDDQGASARFGVGSSRRWNAGRPATAAGSVPAALFTDQRWSPDTAQGLAWRFPVTPGEYEVRLHVAEMYSPAFKAGARRFDVNLEGTLREANVDPFARFGTRTGGVLSWRVVSDAQLDIRLRHREENPAVQGIEIIALGNGDVATPPAPLGPGRLAIDTLDLEFGSALLGERRERELVLSNTGQTALRIGRVSSSLSSSLFAVSLQPGTTLEPGAQRRERIVFTPSSVGRVTALVTIAHDGEDGTELLSLSGSGLPGLQNDDPNPQDGDPSDDDPSHGGTGGTGDGGDNGGGGGLADGTLTSVWRINIGGQALLGGDGVTWQADDDDRFDGFRHGSSRRYSTKRTISVDDEAPVAANAALFRTERWGNDAAQGLDWSFPVAPGRYEVHLYFAEIYSRAFADGKRTFDITLEGQTMLEAMDVFEQAGANSGIVKRFVIDSDAQLDVVLKHRRENPALKAIEILACRTACS